MACNTHLPLVLIVDADQTTRDLYGDWFSSIGFQVMCAVGMLGLSLALARERPQLIVTEIRAGDLTVGDLTRRLRSDESTRCIPVLVITSCTDDTKLTAAKTSGAVAILPKLADFSILKSWVDALCDLSEVHGLRP